MRNTDEGFIRLIESVGDVFIVLIVLIERLKNQFVLEGWMFQKIKNFPLIANVSEALSAI